MPPRLNSSTSTASRRSTMRASGNPSTNSRRATSTASRITARNAGVSRRAWRSSTVYPCRSITSSGMYTRPFSRSTRDVLPEIRQLQRRAGRVRERLPLRVAIAAQVQHQPSHRVGRIPAVSEHILVGAVAHYGLVLHERPDQVGEWLLRQLVPRRGLLQRHEHRMRRPALVHPLQLPAPPLQQPQALLRVADLVAQVVGPAAEGVHVVEVLVQPARKQERHHVEVLVVARGQPARVFLGFLPRYRCGPGLPATARNPGAGRNTGSCAGHGMIAVFRCPLWLIRCRITSSRLASGSSRFTKSCAVMILRRINSSALRMCAGVWWKLALQVISE